MSEGDAALYDGRDEAAWHNRREKLFAEMLTLATAEGQTIELAHPAGFVVEVFHPEHRISPARARDLIAEEFRAAGWDEGSTPALDDSGCLNDGRHWEDARTWSEDALREQCREWVASFGG